MSTKACPRNHEQAVRPTTTRVGQTKQCKKRCKGHKPKLSTHSAFRMIDSSEATPAPRECPQTTSCRGPRLVSDIRGCPTNTQASQGRQATTSSLKSQLRARFRVSVAASSENKQPAPRRTSTVGTEGAIEDIFVASHRERKAEGEDETRKHQAPSTRP